MLVQRFRVKVETEDVEELVISGTAGAAYGYVDMAPGRVLSDDACRDYTIGVIIPIGHPRWTTRRVLYRDRAIDPLGAFCAAVGAAATILHEMVHVCGGEGARHDLSFAGCGRERPPCHDEATMANSAFLWAMSRRFPALGLHPCCQPFGMDENFLRSRCGPNWACDGGVPDHPYTLTDGA